MVQLQFNISNKIEIALGHVCQRFATLHPLIWMQTVLSLNYSSNTIYQTINHINEYLEIVYCVEWTVGPKLKPTSGQANKSSSNFCISYCELSLQYNYTCNGFQVSSSILTKGSRSLGKHKWMKACLYVSGKPYFHCWNLVFIVLILSKSSKTSSNIPFASAIIFSKRQATRLNYNGSRNKMMEIKY